MTFSDTVEDASLPVLVLTINISSMFNKQTTDFVVAFSSRIEQWNLFEIIFLVAIYAQGNECFAHLQRSFFNFDDTCWEDCSLTETLLIINEVLHVNPIISDHRDYFFNVTFLDLLEELLHESGLGS